MREGRCIFWCSPLPGRNLRRLEIGSLEEALFWSLDT
jgi:hypothetical protein